MSEIRIQLGPQIFDQIPTNACNKNSSLSLPLLQALVCNASDSNSRCARECGLTGRNRRSLPYSQPLHVDLVSQGPILMEKIEKGKQGRNLYNFNFNIFSSETACFVGRTLNMNNKYIVKGFGTQIHHKKGLTLQRSVSEA